MVTGFLVHASVLASKATGVAKNVSSVSFSTSFIKATGYARTRSVVAGITVPHAPCLCHVEAMLDSVSTGLYRKTGCSF